MDTIVFTWWVFHTQMLECKACWGTPKITIAVAATNHPQMFLAARVSHFSSKMVYIYIYYVGPSEIYLYLWFGCINQLILIQHVLGCTILTQARLCRFDFLEPNRSAKTDNRWQNKPLSPVLENHDPL